MNSLLNWLTGLWTARAAAATLPARPVRLESPVFLAFFCVAVALFFFIRIAMTEGLIFSDLCVLGTDVGRYTKGLEEGSLFVLSIRKHAVAVIVVGAVAKSLALFSVPYVWSAALAMSACAGIGATALFIFLFKNVAPANIALSATLAFLMAFGSVTTFSVVETYVITFASISIALLSWGWLAKMAGKNPRQCAMAAGVAGALPGLSYIPSVIYVVAYAGLSWPMVAGGTYRRLQNSLLVPAAIAAGLSLLPYAYLDSGDGFQWQARYLGTYTDLSHFTDGAIVADYLASFFVYSWIAPLDYVQCRFTISELLSGQSGWWRPAATLIVITAMAFGFGRGTLDKARRPLFLAMCMIIAGSFCFHLWFNPQEALLYSSLWTLATMICAAVGFSTLHRGATYILVIAAIFVYANLPPLHQPRGWVEPACCPY
jgi:hypothetical protein